MCITYSNISYNTFLESVDSFSLVFENLNWSCSVRAGGHLDHHAVYYNHTRYNYSTEDN